MAVAILSLILLVSSISADNSSEIIANITSDTVANRSGACSAIPWLHICDFSGYDKLTPPGLAINGSTTPVEIELYVESVGNFKATTMDYDMDIYFVEHWTDTRLKHDHAKSLTVRDKKTLDQLWIPDVYFANSKHAQYNLITVPNCALRIYEDGTIRYSVRIHLKIACHMDLKSYPIDTQLCYLKILTYGSETDEVQLTWITSSSDPIQLNPEITQSDLKVSFVKATDCNGTYWGKKYSCLLASFYLKRDIGYSLMQVYLPTSFIVAISWISFWIDPCSVPGRVGLCVTTLLTLSTQAIGLTYHLPPVGYAKAQDIWFGVCIMFLFGALVEFALVNMFLRQAENAENEVRRAMNTKKVTSRKRSSALETALIQNANEAIELTGNGVIEIPMPDLDMDKLISTVARIYKVKAVWTDRISRITFPSVFALFCIAYWCVYCFRQGPGQKSC